MGYGGRKAFTGGCRVKVGCSVVTANGECLLDCSGDVVEDGGFLVGK